MHELIWMLTVMCVVAAGAAWCADRVPERWVDGFAQLFGVHGEGR